MHFIKDEQVLLNLDAVTLIRRQKNKLEFWFSENDCYQQDCVTDSDALESFDVLAVELDRIQNGKNKL